MKIVISDFDRLCRHSEPVKVTNKRIDIESITFKLVGKKWEKKTSNQHCKKVKEAKKKGRTKKGRLK